MASIIPHAAALPPGAVQLFAMATPPTGWLSCDGSAVSRTTHARLFAALGTNYGAGDGSTTFNLPDLRGEFVRGWDDGRGVDSGRALGSSQADELASHGHNASASSVPDHVHGLPVDNDDAKAGGATFASDDQGRVMTNDTDPAGAHTPSVSVDPTGGAETRPRNVAMLYAIKV